MCCKTGTFPGTDPVGDRTTKTGTVPGNLGRLVTLLNVRYIKIHGPTSNRPIVDHGGEFRITSGLHKYACDLTLDTNTANKHLILSDDNRKVTFVNYRFDGWPQVLSVESLTGRCYWETEWSGDDVYISVSYKEIKRKGGSLDYLFGGNVISWCLICSDHRFTALHNNKSTAISAGSVSSKRVGVYVDVSGGTLSFYSISDTHKFTRLHTFTHTFTQTLYAGFFVGPNCSASLLQEVQYQTHKTDSDHQDEDVSPVRDTFCVSVSPTQITHSYTQVKSHVIFTLLYHIKRLFYAN
ncbi:Tripartite motif-containing protein 16 [Labeo rohita]|uniref:Tripartite motif-containing protein 16 n=1 Tax=Labeo rohita TaxID=84645 RepID=A0ABQ8L8Q5_LABRO|nr:Tripartite motif-containing protein 16 [Labeo rohita]